jgi:hypothetical protein
MTIMHDNGPSSYIRKIKQALHALPFCPLTSSTIMCQGYIAPLFLTHLGTLRKKCNYNLMCVNMERERERERDPKPFGHKHWGQNVIGF